MEDFHVLPQPHESKGMLFLTKNDMLLFIKKCQKCQNETKKKYGKDFVKIALKKRNFPFRCKICKHKSTIIVTSEIEIRFKQYLKIINKKKMKNRLLPAKKVFAVKNMLENIFNGTKLYDSNVDKKLDELDLSLDFALFFNEDDITGIKVFIVKGLEIISSFEKEFDGSENFNKYLELLGEINGKKG